MDLAIRLAIAVTYRSVFTAAFMAIWPIKMRTFLVHLLLFVVLCSIMVVNDQFELVEEKVASFLSYDIFLGKTWALTFLLQYFVSRPAFFITESPYSAHSVNLAVQSISFLIAFRFIIRERVNTIAGFALCIFPAYFNFTIFGLRDPYINLICTIFVAGVINKSSKGIFITTAFLAVVCIFARPEFSLMLFAFGLLWLFMASSILLKSLSLVVYAGALYGALLIMPLAFGLSSTGSAVENIQKIIDFKEQRNERRLGDTGSGSHILNGQLYTLPIEQRFPVQVAATFIAPLPFEIKGNVQALAFAESIFFTLVATLAWIYSKSVQRARFLFYCGIIYMMGFAIFSINYGNILRMRYPAHIIFVGAIACAFNERRRISESQDAPLERWTAVEQSAEPARTAIQAAQKGGQKGLDGEEQQA